MLKSRIRVFQHPAKLILVPIVFIFFNCLAVSVLMIKGSSFLEIVPLVILNGIVFYDLLTRKRSKERDNFNRIALLISFFIFPVAIGSPYLEVALRGSKRIDLVFFIPGILTEALGGYLVISSRRILGTMGTPSLVIEKNHVLINKGLYKHIRNPMYLGFICLLIGYSISLCAFISCVLTNTIIIGYLLKRTRIEEKLLEEKFGNEYLAYKKRTKRFIPWLY
ncbi:MAG: hypothetical protein A2Y32_10690 [Spirochaetes bacterium GWF1_60_12]|nr:MAG: hypothetical protein A2Y32_10690 [Spirochaetes bacterium GWF1_60_12]HAP42973.1 hypothetical protein [Spirochaetaceae bacterium]